MNFGSGPAGGGGGGNANAGPELEQIETEQLGFQALSGGNRLRLLPTPWPAENLPSTTSSLLSIAPTKGLLAAAGPDTLVIATTDSVRQTIITEKADEDSKVSFMPQATIQIPRVSHVIFSSDETCLVIVAEQRGGLAVYDTNALLNGGKGFEFQLATEGQAVRQILPNPNPSQDLSRYFGIVTENGQLLLADLKEQKLVNASNGSTVFHEGVSCASWSRLGKQIIAGLANGTAVQIDQQGAVKGEIPEPPQLAQWKDPNSRANPITSIFWLETYDFLIVHTPINAPDAGANDDSIYHLAHKDKASGTWTFRKIPDPCPAFGMERKPAQHFIQRLREWLDLSEVLILASTASTDIGIFTRTKSAPLDPQNPIIDTFTYTQPEDARRAAMAMGESGDTSPIGMAVDLSAKEKAPRPIPTEELLDESPVPLPALFVLDNEGMLNTWWIVYRESVKQSSTYPDLVAAGGPRALGGEQKQQQGAQQTSSRPSSSSAMSPFASTTQPHQTPAFGQSSFGTSTKPQQTSTFGQPSFGSAGNTAFGGTSSLGNRQSPWAAPGAVATSGPKFGQSSFGQPSAFGGGSAFGQAGGMGGNKGSVWGTPAQPSQNTPAQTGGGVFGGNASAQSPFMNVGNKAPAASPFSAFGSGGTSQSSPFASKPALSNEPSGSTVSFGNGTSFGSGSTNFGISSFGTPSPTKTAVPSTREESMDDEEASQTSTVKPPAPQTTTGDSENKGGLFGLGSGGFKLGSTFKGDGTAKDDLPKPKNPGASLFGNDFGSALGIGDTGKKSASEQSGSEGAWWSGASTPVVKKEPGTEEVPKLSDIPPVPASQKKASPPPSPAVDDAPLPPDPTTWKPKPGALPPPIPPGFGADFGKPSSAVQDAKKVETKEAPPPADSTTPESKKSHDAPVAGSPPVDLGGDKFSEGVPSVDEAEEAGPPESEDDEGEWSDEDEGEGEGDEDDDDDEGEDEDDEPHTVEITDPKGLAAFEARLTPASPKRQSAKESTTPATDKKDSYTPAGMPKAPIMFPPPKPKDQQSPRSPSPVRNATSPMRLMHQQQASSRPSSGLFGSISSSKPPALTQSPLPSSQAKAPSQSQLQPPQRIAVPPAQLSQRPEKPIAPPKPTEPEAGDLEDEEDARIQSILAAPVEPTTEVPAFLAHQEYAVGSDKASEKTGLGGQIERVFRDVNSMIDTLALNARSLRGFVEGNMQAQSGGRSRLDLEEDDDWLLGEAGQLQEIMKGIDVELEDGRLEDVRGLQKQLWEEDKELGRLRVKSTEIRKVVKARSDPEEVAIQQAAALPLELAVQQSELRQGVQKLQKLLAKAEEQLSVLRADLASLPQSQGSKDGGIGGVPTVEAVTNTILKMTAMVEKKSGDIDVLEAQIRRLPSGVKSLNGDYEDDLAATLKASKLSRHSSSPSNGLKSSRAGLDMRVSAYGSPRRGRAGTPGTPGVGRRSLMDVSDGNVELYRIKRDGRRKVLDRLQELVEVRGPRVVKVGE